MRRAFAVVCAGLVWSTGLPTPARSASPACEALAFSPSFEKDHTMFCASRTASRIFVRRSIDAGRRWTTRQVGSEPASSVEIVMSPLFPTDRTIAVVAPGEAFWISDDGGATYRSVTPAPQRGLHALTAYAEQYAGAPGTERLAIAQAPAALIGASVFDSATGWRSVTGASANNLWFLVPPDFAARREAVVLARGLGATPGSVGTGPLRSYACRADLVCLEPLRDFGSVALWWNGPSARDTFFVAVETGDVPDPLNRRTYIWRTRDYGRTWSRWTGAEKVFAAARNAGDSTVVTLVTDPDRPRRKFMQVVGDWNSRARAKPVWSLYRSEDDGTTWTRIGYAWAPKQGRSGGTLPWNHPGASTPAQYGWLSAQPGGRLYALGARHDGKRATLQVYWCSTDGGVRWRATC